MPKQNATWWSGRHGFHILHMFHQIPSPLLLFVYPTSFDYLVGTCQTTCPSVRKKESTDPCLGESNTTIPHISTRYSGCFPSWLKSQHFHEVKSFHGVSLYQTQTVSAVRSHDTSSLWAAVSRIPTGPGLIWDVTKSPGVLRRSLPRCSRGSHAAPPSPSVGRVSDASICQGV